MRDSVWRVLPDETIVPASLTWIETFEVTFPVSLSRMAAMDGEATPLAARAEMTAGPELSVKKVVAWIMSEIDAALAAAAQAVEPDISPTAQEPAATEYPEIVAGMKPLDSFDPVEAMDARYAAVAEMAAREEPLSS